MPSPDTKINNFNSNLIDMAMDKIKRYSSSLAPPLAPPQLPQPTPTPPQIIPQYIPMPMPMSMPTMSMPSPSAPSYAPSLAPSMPPSNFATPAMTPLKPPPPPPPAAAAAAGKPPPPPPPPPPPGTLPTEPSLSAASDLAGAAAALAALNPIINDIVAKMIGDPLIDKEITETGSGKEEVEGRAQAGQENAGYSSRPDCRRSRKPGCKLFYSRYKVFRYSAVYAGYL